MRLRKLLIAMIAVMMMACSNASAVSSSEGVSEYKLSSEYEMLPENNRYVIADKENVERFLRHGTGMIVFGFPACKWCQAYLPIFNEVLEEADANCLYYNIRKDKDDDRPFYDQIADVVEELNDTGEQIIEYDNDGRSGIYMPLVLFVEEGRIVAYNNDTSMISSDENTPDAYWTEERKAEVTSVLAENTAEIKALQDEHDDRGCDTGCEVKPAN